ncbi:MAG: hypothetical protein HC783_16485 [Rhodobacteraceae bacterium]|nr:hypothetical protein [Paracoccaceae bacterium]
MVKVHGKAAPQQVTSGALRLEEPGLGGGQAHEDRAERKGALEEEQDYEGGRPFGAADQCRLPEAMRQRTVVRFGQTNLDQNREEDKAEECRRDHGDGQTHQTARRGVAQRPGQRAKDGVKHQNVAGEDENGVQNPRIARPARRRA